jgi:hypothetical protein
MLTVLFLADVARLLRREICRTGASLKSMVNYFLRLGLAAPERRENRPFVVRARPLGLPPGFSYDNIEDLVEALEGTTHK